jgi:hypothetical protein
MSYENPQIINHVPTDADRAAAAAAQDRLADSDDAMPIEDLRAIARSKGYVPDHSQASPATAGQRAVYVERPDSQPGAHEGQSEPINDQTITMGALRELRERAQPPPQAQ